MTHKSKKNKPGDDKHKPKGKSGDHGKGKHRVTQNLEKLLIRKLLKKCLFCTQVHSMKKELCPTSGKTCMDCGGKNNFRVSSKCKCRTVHSVGEDYSTKSSESNSETISAIMTDQNHFVTAAQPDNQFIFCEMEVNKKPTFSF